MFLHVISGMLNKQIADELNIKEHTVKVHRGRVMQKLGVDSVASLVRLAESDQSPHSPSIEPKCYRQIN